MKTDMAHSTQRLIGIHKDSKELGNAHKVTSNDVIRYDLVRGGKQGFPKLPTYAAHLVCFVADQELSVSPRCIFSSSCVGELRNAGSLDHKPNKRNS